MFVETLFALFPVGQQMVVHEFVLFRPKQASFDLQRSSPIRNQYQSSLQHNDLLFVTQQVVFLLGYHVWWINSTVIKDSTVVASDDDGDTCMYKKNLSNKIVLRLVRDDQPSSPSSCV
jgi:hypothetical protein